MKISPELEGLAKFVIETKWENLPPKVINDTKLFLMDSIGCGLGGILTDPGKIAITVAKRMGGPPESSIIGVKGKVSCVSAVLANGQLINALDWEALTGHAPPYIVPPALAMAESYDASGQDLIIATAVALEVAMRVNAALASGGFIIGDDGHVRWPDRQGYANLNFGVAAAAGKLMKLNQDKMIHAMSTAGHLSQVLTWVRHTFQEPRGMVKYGVSGWQNTGGVIAALLAESGFFGDPTVFDSDQGFWKFVGYGGWNPERILKDIGKEWLFFKKILFKPFPSCRQFQTETEAFLHIMDTHKLLAKDIESIKIYGHPTFFAPAFTSRELNHIVDIHFSPAYTLAMAAQGFPPGVEWQDMEVARTPAVTDLVNRISYTGHPEFREKQIVRVEVAARGQTFVAERPFNSLYEMSEQDLIKKYKHNAYKILTENQVENSLAYFLSLEKLPRTSLLAEQIT
ncbi:MAG TPA: MmgE/PrpD family protein [Dehalococcoidales bacterium]|nr:MmgE/PrpD family protein [Dehalococcoidales bacterium]